MSQLNILACPDCQKKYSQLEHLNKHIVKTGCNNGIKIQYYDIFKACGLLKIKIGNQTIDLMSPIPAI